MPSNPDPRISMLMILNMFLALMLIFSANFVKNMIDFQPSFPVTGF